MKIGVITDCFKLPLNESLRLAGGLGFDGVQIYATTGEFSPEVLTAERKAEIKGILSEQKLEISALCGDMGGYGFQIAEDNPLRIEKTKAIIDLAEEFGVSVITTHIGVIPDDKSDPRYAVLLDALTACGEYAKTKGVTLAIETGPETAPTLLAFLKDTNGGVGVNLDPANFVMVTGQDPVEAVRMLGKYIVHTHAKDGNLLVRGNPEYIYRAVHPVPAEAEGVQYFEEVPLGTGSVPFPAYLKALEDIGYKGFLTIEREAGEDPAADIKTAYDFLKKTMA